jgi:hypothetical protein
VGVFNLEKCLVLQHMYQQHMAVHEPHNISAVVVKGSTAMACCMTSMPDLGCGRRVLVSADNVSTTQPPHTPHQHTHLCMIMSAIDTTALPCPLCQLLTGES